MGICPKCNSTNVTTSTVVFNWNHNYNCFLHDIRKRKVCHDCNHCFMVDNANITLFKEEWLSLKQNKGYTYLHEERANGTLIAILPYRKNDNNYEYLMRYEICPAHGDDHEFCMIIGSRDDLNISIDETAIKELKEEAGFEINSSELRYLDWIWDSKVSDTKVYLYTVDLTNKIQHTPITDGTKLEQTAYCKWEKLNDCYNAKDPKIFAILNKILYSGVIA